MVKDPATGKMISAPEYGGTITFATTRFGGVDHVDMWFHHHPGETVAGVLEKLAIMDWAMPRDQFAFRTTYKPLSLYTGHLAESWEQPDPLTMVFHIRKGVHWQNNADSTRKCNSPSGEERQAASASAPFKLASMRGADERLHTAHPGRTTPDCGAFESESWPKRDCDRAEAPQVHDQPRGQAQPRASRLPTQAGAASGSGPPRGKVRPRIACGIRERVEACCARTGVRSRSAAGCRGSRGRVSVMSGSTSMLCGQAPSQSDRCQGTRRPRLLRSPPPFLGAGTERKHQRAPATVFPKSHRTLGGHSTAGAPGCS